ncbi:MAG: hypothetical protein AB7L41_11315 [Flavobacteriaceae bacterium]
MGYRVGVVGGAVFAALVGVASAQETPREGARLVILDTCVYAMSTKANSFTDFTKVCNCAAEKALGELSESSMASITRSGSLGFSNSGIWRKHYKECGGE